MKLFSILRLYVFIVLVSAIPLQDEYLYNMGAIEFPNSRHDPDLEEFAELAYNSDEYSDGYSGDDEDLVRYVQDKFNEANSRKYTHVLESEGPPSWQVVPDSILRLIAAGLEDHKEAIAKAAKSHEIITKNTSETRHHYPKDDQLMSRTASTDETGDIDPNLKNKHDRVTSNLTMSSTNKSKTSEDETKHKVESAVSDDSRSLGEVQNIAVTVSDEQSVNDTNNSGGAIDLSREEDALSGKSLFGQLGMKCSPLLHSCGPGFNCIRKGETAECTPVRNNLCDLNICKNGGACVVTENIQKCICAHGFTGENCHVPSGPCHPNPCQGGCRCIESCRHEFGYHCESNGIYTGKNCSIPLPRVKCEEKSITIDIPSVFVDSYDQRMRNSFMYVSPTASSSRSSHCQAQTVSGGYQIQIPLPFDTCGTTRGVTASSQIKLRNKLWIDRGLTTFGMAIPVIEFECTYSREYLLITSIKPIISIPQIIQKSNEIVPQFDLCKAPTCPRQCPSSYLVSDAAVYTVGELIYLTVTGDSKNSFPSMITTVEQMTISCKSDGARMNILSNGCKLTWPLISATNTGSSVCISLQTPRAFHCQSLFLHIHLRFCEASKIQACEVTNSQQHCSESRERGKRGTDNPGANETDFYTVIGPITLLKGSVGTETVTVLEDGIPFSKHEGTLAVSVNKKIPNVDDAERGHQIATIVTAVLLSSVVVMSVSLYFICRCSSCKGIRV